jgi:hypothetical protein
VKIAEIFEQFSEKMVQIELYQRAVKELAQKEFKQLCEYAEVLEKNPDFKEMPSSYQNMFFRDAQSGRAILFGHKQSGIEDQKLSVILHKNKQYQWLLAEAYEEFEDFLENIYAYCGLHDPNFWPLVDYGNILLGDVKEKDFIWYLERARNKKDLPHSILNQLRKKCPEITDIEVNNALEQNLRFAVVLIEKLRHFIVHKGGIVHDRAKFIAEVLDKVGLGNNGKPKLEDTNFIGAFFGSEEYSNTILLLEVRTQPEIPLDIHISRIGMLFGYLMTYAHLICEALNRRIVVPAGPGETATK